MFHHLSALPLLHVYNPVTPITPNHPILFLPCIIVISPELIREVESRMNRNYLPPALKMQQHQSHTHPQGAPNSTLSQSPPTTSLMTYHSSSSSNILPAQALSNTPLAGQQGPPSATGNSRRVHFKSTNKLPTVQEVGKFFFALYYF